MEILDERFRSRFEWGLIVDITLPDYETRMAILHKKEDMDGYNVSEDVIKYIANNIKSNIRELEGAFNKVVAYAKLEKKEVTLELAEQALKDIIAPNETKQITADYIISMVAEHYNVSTADLCGNKFQDCYAKAGCHVPLPRNSGDPAEKCRTVSWKS